MSVVDERRQIMFDLKNENLEKEEKKVFSLEKKERLLKAVFADSGVGYEDENIALGFVMGLAAARKTQRKNLRSY